MQRATDTRLIASHVASPGRGAHANARRWRAPRPHRAARRASSAGCARGASSRAISRSGCEPISMVRTAHSTSRFRVIVRYSVRRMIWNGRLAMAWRRGVRGGQAVHGSDGDRVLRRGARLLPDANEPMLAAITPAGRLSLRLESRSMICRSRAAPVAWASRSIATPSHSRSSRIAPCCGARAA